MQVNRADNESARTALQNQGIEFVHPDAAQQDNWESMAKQVRETLIRRAKYTPALVDEMLGHIEDYRSRHGSGDRE